MDTYNFNWIHNELRIELLSNTYGSNTNSHSDSNIRILLNLNDNELASLPIEDSLLLLDLKESLTRLLLHDYKKSILLTSTESHSDNNTIDSFIKSYVIKEEVGEPLIDNLFINIERFDYEIKKYALDDVSLQTSYRITLGTPLYKGSSMFKSIIINDLSQDKIKELLLVINSFIEIYLQKLT